MTNTTSFGKFILKLQEVNSSMTIAQAMDLYNSAIAEDGDTNNNDSIAECPWTAPSGRIIPESVYSTFEPNRPISAIRDLRMHRRREGKDYGLIEVRDDVNAFYKAHYGV